MLGFKVSMKSDEKDDDGYEDEGGAERLSDVTETGAGQIGGGRRDCRVEAKKLGYCYADGGEGERGAEPG